MANSLLALSAQWKREADKLLRESQLSSILAKFGELQHTGSYVYDVMLGADIDIYVTASIGEAKSVALAALHTLIEQNYWNGYLFYDFAAHTSSYHPEFPKVYYVGVKSDFSGHRWKVDVWFGEHETLNSEDNTWIKDAMTDTGKEVILEIKQARNDGLLDASSHAIYTAVLKDNVMSPEQFLAWQHAANVQIKD